MLITKCRREAIPRIVRPLAVVLGLKIGEIDYLATSGVTDTALGYDAGTNQKGRLTSVVQITSGETVTRTLGYDPFGNVASTVQTLPAPGGGRGSAGHREDSRSSRDAPAGAGG